MVSGNLLGKLNVQMQAWLRLPPGIDGLKAEAYLKRAEVQLEQIQRRIELEDRQQTAAEAKAELLRVQAESRLMVQEKRARLYDLEIVQAELEVERQRQRLEAGEGQKALPPGSEEAHPRSPGLQSKPLRHFRGDRGVPGGVRGLVGRLARREGHSASWPARLGQDGLYLQAGEYVFAVHQMPVWFVGMPEEVAAYLPRWVSIAAEPEQMDLVAFMIVDESGLQYMANRHQSDRNTVLRRLLQIARHRRQGLVFIA